MFQSFIAGALAGYAIAIPVGAIAVLILETSLRKGFLAGFAAGSGAATADLIYATLAATLGSALVLLLAPIASLLKLASAAFLIVFGAWGLIRLASRRQTSPTRVEAPDQANLGRTYATLLSLTLLNPATIAYFAALILGLDVRTALSGGKLSFVLGAFLASWSWQTVLAAVGAIAHKHLSPNFQSATSLLGNLVIIGLGLKIVI